MTLFDSKLVKKLHGDDGDQSYGLRRRGHMCRCRISRHAAKGMTAAATIPTSVVHAKGITAMATVTASVVRASAVRASRRSTTHSHGPSPVGVVGIVESTAVRHL